MAAERNAKTADRKYESHRALMQKKIDRLMSFVEQLRNGEEFKALLAHAEKAEKIVADLIAKCNK